MSGQSEDDDNKTNEPTPQKLKKARERGEVPRSNDISVTASYAGFYVALVALGASVTQEVGKALQVVLNRSDGLSSVVFSGASNVLVTGILHSVSLALAPLFLLPIVAVVLAVFAQRAFVFAPSKIRPKLSRISVIANAKNKFGLSGWFEFAKSFAKLLIYSFCLGLFLRYRFPVIMTGLGSDPRSTAMQLAQISIEFLLLVLLVSGPIGVVDLIWQHREHRRKNRMSHKEIMDEIKEAEGDPHLKQKRRQFGQEVAMSRMMADVPEADVIIVNPTHFAVALTWSRQPGSAPVCVAKGVDEMAATIRRIANENGVPVHSDPPTARAIHATVEIGQEIDSVHFAAVAVAIRFAEDMKTKVRRGF